MAKIQKNVAEDIYGPFVRLFEDGVLKVQEHEPVDHNERYKVRPFYYESDNGLGIKRNTQYSRKEVLLPFTNE